MVHLSKLAASLATVVQLLPARRHVHMWNVERCTPTSCETCGATLRPSWSQRLRAAMDDALDCWGD